MASASREPDDAALKRAEAALSSGKYLEEGDSSVSPASLLVPRADHSRSATANGTSGKSIFNKKLLEIITTVAIVATMVVGVFQWYIFRRQANIMERQLTSMEDSGKQTDELIHQYARSADAMSLAAKAASDQASETAAQNKILNDQATTTVAESSKALNTMIAISQNDQRPWVGILSAKAMDPSHTSDRYAIKGLEIVLMNTGKTPAVKLSMKCCIATLRPLDAPVPSFAEEVRRDHAPALSTNIGTDQARPERNFVNQDGIVIAPTATPVYTFPINIGFSTKSQVRPDHPEDHIVDTIPYFVGEITYRDMLSQRLHTTSFCLMRVQGDDLHYCPKGNGMN